MFQIRSFKPSETYRRLHNLTQSARPAEKTDEFEEQSRSILNFLVVKAPHNPPKNDNKLKTSPKAGAKPNRFHDAAHEFRRMYFSQLQPQTPIISRNPSLLYSRTNSMFFPQLVPTTQIKTSPVQTPMYRVDKTDSNINFHRVKIQSSFFPQILEENNIRTEPLRPQSVFERPNRSKKYIVVSGGNGPSHLQFEIRASSVQSLRK